MCNSVLLYISKFITLPYHTGKMFYRLVLRPLTGPMRIPKLTGSIPTLGTIPSQVRAYSLGPTY